MAVVEDDSFGLRDLSPSDVGRSYRALMKNQHCGWLQYQSGKYLLTDCGEPGRIPLDAVDAKFGTHLEEFVKKSDNFKKDAGRTAKAKYETIGNCLYRGNFTEDTELISIMTEANPVDKRLFVKFGGNRKGTLVLTGQPGVRQQKPDKRTKKLKWSGKFYEFVFFDVNTPAQEVSEDIIRAFKTVHKNSPDFAEYWGAKLTKGEKIPVFFQFVKLEGKDQLHSIGLSYLYKYPYEQSVREAIPHDLENQKEKSDLADCIFGYTNGNNSLKGRVQFSAAFSENVKQDRDVFLTLGSPKASYYPFYIKQNGTSGKVSNYDTYDNGIISGWKRYPVRQEIWDNKKNKFDEKLDTIIHPVQKGSLFIGKVRYHNLKRVELGALLSALTFHNMSECYHQIGQGKPYGFGKVKIDIKLPEELEKQKLELMAEFEKKVSETIVDWANNTSIVELFSMAKEEITADSVSFQYMTMDTDRKNNQFLTAKENKEYLELYSKLKARATKPVSLIPLFIDKFEEEKRKQAVLEEQKRLEEEQKRQNELRLKQEEEVKLQQENLQKKIEGGLAFLTEKNMKDEYKVQDFKGAKSRIEQWMKKAKVSQLPEDQWDILFKCISRLNEKPDRKERTLWSDFNSSVWETISRFVGNEKAKEWFGQIVRCK
jgi:CRISPR-associated protein (TIGR03986 family)